MKMLTAIVVPLMLGLAVAAGDAGATNVTNTVVATNTVATVAGKKADGKQSETSARSQCEATTKSGSRCKRKAAKGERFCRQHLKIRASSPPDASPRGAAHP